MKARNFLPRNKNSKKENLERQLIISSYDKDLKQTTSKVTTIKKNICS